MLIQQTCPRTKALFATIFLLALLFGQTPLAHSVELPLGLYERDGYSLIKLEKTFPSTVYQSSERIIVSVPLHCRFNEKILYGVLVIVVQDSDRAYQQLRKEAGRILSGDIISPDDSRFATLSKYSSSTTTLIMDGKKPVAERIISQWSNEVFTDIVTYHLQDSSIYWEFYNIYGTPERRVPNDFSEKTLALLPPSDPVLLVYQELDKFIVGLAACRT